MIPISADIPVRVKDETDNVTYLYRLITGETEILWNRIITAWRVDHKPYIAEATARIEASGIEYAKGEKEKAIRKDAIEIAQGVEFVACVEREIRAKTDLIDACLVGWEGDNLPKFPEDKKPSKCFKKNDLNDIFKTIIQINGLGDSEAKNS